MGKNQHYVPQFYLRGFAGSEGIDLYRPLKSSRHTNIPTKSILYKKWLYDSDNHIESALSELESIWNASYIKLINAVVCDGDSYSLEDKSIIPFDILVLLDFISFSLVRTLQMIDGFYFQTEESLKDLERRYPDTTIEDTPGFAKAHDKHVTAETLISSARSLREIFEDLHFVLLVNNTKRDFITSDVPVLTINPFLETIHYPLEHSYGQRGLQLYLPLNPRLAILFFDSDVYEFEHTDNWISLSKHKDVNVLNRLVVDNSYENLIVPTSFPNCELKGLCKSKKKPFFGVELRVYENDEGNVVYGHHRLSIHSKYLVPGMKMKAGAFSKPLPRNMAGPLRDHVKTVLCARGKDGHQSSEKTPTVVTLQKIVDPSGERPRTINDPAGVMFG